MDALFETLKNLGPARLGMMLLTVVGLIVFFVFIALRSAAPNMTLLYGDLSTSDSTAIAAKLDLSNIPFQMGTEGTQIMVPQSDVGTARMLLAQEGLPGTASMGYELFDRQQGFGTTSFVQNINQLRALEGEIARTIGTLEPIRTARVHLVLPERALFSRESQPATASVFVNLRNRSLMESGQISAIRHLVASAVPQLKPDRVSIIDSDGNLLARGDEPGADGFGSGDTSTDARLEYEQRVARSIEDMVGRAVGHGRVRATVSADLDFNTLSRNSEIYDPDGQVVRSTQVITEDETDTTGAGAANEAVTVQNNLPGLPGDADAGGGAGISLNRSEEVTNFEITRTIENFVQERGVVNRLSVAVLVDGKYIPGAAAEDAAEAEAEEGPADLEYVPRTEAELEQIRSLVRSSIGFDDDRGDTLEVINMQFAKEPGMDNIVGDETILGLPQEDIMRMAETLILSLVAVLAILLVLRPLVSHIAKAASASTERTASGGDSDPRMLASTGAGQPQLAAPAAGGAASAPSGGNEMSELESTLDMSNVEGQVKQSSLKKIHDLVDKHPNETVAVIRNWMTQEG